MEKSPSESDIVSVAVLRFILCFVATFPISFDWRLVPSRLGKHIYSAASGAFLSYLSFGFSSNLHFLVPMTIGYASMAIHACYVTSVYSEHWWIEGDATDLPFDDYEFDAITMGYGLRNVVDRDIAMREMYRVLKPGSKVSILDFNKFNQSVTAFMQDWMIDNVVVLVATVYGLAKEYEYLKCSINGYLTGEELETLALEAGFLTCLGSPF